MRIRKKDFENASFRVDITSKEGITPIEFEIKQVENEIEKRLVKTIEIPIMPKKKSKILIIFTLLIIIALLLSLFLVANYYFDLYSPINQQLAKIILRIPFEKLPLRF